MSLIGTVIVLGAAAAAGGGAYSWAKKKKTTNGTAIAAGAGSAAATGIALVYFWPLLLVGGVAGAAYMWGKSKGEQKALPPGSSN